MTEKMNFGGSPSTRKNTRRRSMPSAYARWPLGARQTDVARAPGMSLALLGRWQRQALEQAVPSNAERAEMEQLRAELKRVKMERDIVKKVVTIFAQTPQT
ncbi:hypothetical protein [Hymenobacter elongatus]|uniref:Transposase n=1 Tax=Hymenobacter elongatus TaxID=877208 RepID=A0A4Z0PE59_9BACT|nr:hypothetical protein [Hymenobacter elongatus]TGE12074.1 hypothetical protein E5J99_20545 [Hymenobacter elongatus]